MKSFAFLLFALLTGVIACAQVGINDTGAPPDSKAMLDVSSPNRGFLPPRMSDAARDAIAPPVPFGLVIYNITTNCQNFYNGTNWMELCGTCVPPPPAAPTEGVHVPSATEIEWHWAATPGATGYTWNTSSDFETSTDLGNVTSFEQTGLECSTEHTLYLWAYNTCGIQSPAVLTQFTSTCPLSDFCGTIPVKHAAGSVSAVNKSVTYGTVSYNSKCWIDRNLGADDVALTSTDDSEAAAGWYWQFNRAQGRQNTGGTSNTPAWSITSINENSNWTSGNDPCTILLGSPWHIPTEAEWTSADTFGGWNSYDDTFATPMKLHAGGFLTPADGSLTFRGLAGFFQTSTQLTNTNGKFFYAGSGSSNMDQDSKADGFPVRCLKD